MFDPEVPEARSSRHARLSRALLLRVAWQVRDRLLPNRDAEDGDCQDVSEAVAEALRRLGHDAWVTFGTDFRGHPHVWVRASGWYVDPTHDQFAAFAETEEEEAAFFDEPVRAGRGEGPG